MEKSILIIDTPTTCTDCPCYDYIHGVCAKTHKDCELRKQAKPTWCPLRHPLKEVNNNFYIYDRQYLFDHLNEEIAILKGTKAFEEFMKARETE